MPSWFTLGDVFEHCVKGDVGVLDVKMWIKFSVLAKITVLMHASKWLYNLAEIFPGKSEKLLNPCLYHRINT